MSSLSGKEKTGPSIDSVLQIRAGSEALKELRENGLNAQRVKLIVGASGGPKWLMLSRLDQYLNGSFLPAANQSIDLIGSSIGSWRMACYAQKDPVAVLREFESLYMNQRYSEKLPPQEITAFVNVVLSQLFAGTRAHDVVANPLRKLHVVAVRNRRWLNGRSKFAQSVGLMLAATGNIVSPKIVESLYPKVLISQGASHAPYSKVPEVVALTAQNLSQALSASGAIPLVMEPSRVEGGKNRWHWDGGMVDYHFSGPFNVKNGIVLYPHFSPRVIPGWFDKGLPWRKIKEVDYRNVVMLNPSQAFIDKLPYGKIPDRHDFLKLDDESRESYWNTVLDQSNQLVDALHDALEKDGGRSLVEPLFPAV